MASAEQRRRAGGAGVQASLPTPEEVAKAQQKADRAARRSSKKQTEILNPDFLKFTIPAIGEREPLVIAVPTQFQIIDITTRRIFDDINAVSQLMLVEAAKISPDDVQRQPILLFKPENLPYVAVALSRSNVREILREAIVKIARIVENGAPTQKHPRLDDVVFLNEEDLSTIGLWFVRRWVEVMMREKNSRRTV